MNELIEEIKLWNTPAVGAYIIWRFTNGYCEKHPHGEAPIGLLHFLATAILTNNELLESINRRRPNLQSFARGFLERQKSDILFTIHDRINAKKEYTLRAIDIAITEGLVVWNVNDGKIYPCKLQDKPKRKNVIKGDLKKIGDKASIMGEWFSQHDLSTIASYLKVVF